MTARPSITQGVWLRRKRLLVVGLLVAFGVALVPNAAPTAGQPAPPTGLSAIARDGSVDLGWQPSSGASGYTIYRGTSATAINTLLTPAAGTTSTGFTDSSAANGTTYYYAARAIVAGVESANSLAVQVKPQARGCTTGNAIVVENCYPGDNTWQVKKANPIGAGGIEGYATAPSVNKGGSVGLKVNADDGATFKIEVYRTGYYGGSGARLMSTVRGVPAVRQPGCITDTVTGLMDCSNWSLTYTLTTTQSWPSGVYLLHLVRDDTGSDFHIILIVRDDASTSKVLYGVSMSTFEAYNGYGGKSLYDFNSHGANTVSGSPRAVKVSFDRPFEQVRDGQQDWYPTDEYATVYWLEQMGYDVSYISNTDLETNPALASAHAAYISPSHDEYWSSAMRSGLQQARDRGTGLFFSGGNEVFWRVRFENSAATGAAGRVLVCYKTTQSGGPDPSGISTTTWRDPNGVNLPENQLTGEMYIGDNDNVSFPFVVNATQGQDRVYRYTGLDTQTPGTSTSIGRTITGWEWDARANNGFEPAGVKTLSGSPVNGALLQAANSIVYGSGNATTSMVKYTAPSGALVVTTGTNHWNRGLALDGFGVGEPDVRIQQTTTNILADMNALPQTAPANITLDSPTANRPPAPTTVTATSQGSDQIGITWAAVAGASGYNVYRSQTPRQGGLPLGVRSNGALVTGTSFTDIGLTAATTYYYVVTAVLNGTQSLASSEASASTAPAAGQPIRLESGGTSDYTATTGALFRADTFFTGGNTNAVTSAISGTTDPALYQTERWGQFTYAIPVVNGTYDVRFHFVELYYGTVAAGGAGKRVFGMDIVNTSASPDLANIDVYADVGARTPDIKTVSNVKVTNGVLTIRSVYGAVDDPEVAAIEVIPQVIPPSVSSTTPDPNATGVTRLTTPTATFSRAMDATTITGSSLTVSTQGGAVVPGSVTYNSGTNTATFTPSAPLSFSTTYVATVAAGVKAADGTALGTAYTWRFTVADPIPLTVSSIFPAAASTGISPNVVLQAAFSRSLDPSTVTPANVTLTQGSTTVPATVSYDDVNRLVLITPSVPLDLATTYTATIGAGVTAPDGVPLSSSTSWSFTTASAAPPAPTVSATTPVDGATGVALTSAASATFTRDMYPARLSASTFTLRGPSGTISASAAYNSATRTVTLTPATHLDPSTTYTATIAGSVSASDGEPLGSAATWTFSTVPAPSVTTTSPADGSAYAARTTAVTATFSRAMAPATLNTSSFTLTGPGGLVSAAISYNSTTNVGTLTPNAPLPGGVTYTARVETSVTDTVGVPLAAPVTWNFSTAACPCSLFSSATVPAASGLPTSDGRGGAGPWSYEFGVKVKVDEPLQVSALRYYKSPGETGTHVGRIWTATGTQLTSVTYANETASGWQQQALVTPFTLQPGATYVISVNTNADFVMTSNGFATAAVSGPLQSVADGANGVHSSAAGQFPTLAWQSSNYFVDLVASPAGDPTPPQVTSTSPLGSATGVPRQSTITATFSRPIDASTVSTSGFVVTGPNGAVAGTVAYDVASLKASFVPLTPLAYSTVYTATLRPAIHGSDGYPIAAYSWSFTVAAAQPPTVVALPVDGASDVAPSTAPRATFSKSIDAITLTPSTFSLVGPSGAVTGTVSYDEPTKSGTFTPSAPLVAGAYTARLDPSIAGMDGSTLSAPYSWSFTVVTGLAAPSVTTIAPADGTTSAPRSQTASAVFSRSMDPLSLATAFTLQAADGTSVPATVSYDSATRTATLTPNLPLAANTTFNARVSTAAKAADGTALPTASTWTFSTAACPCSLFSNALQPALTGLGTQDGRGGAGPWTYEFGVKVRVDQSMQVNALKFYKSAGETGVHTGRIWSSGGTQFASVTFANETDSGWQQQALATPFTLQPGVVYVISVNANTAFSLTYGSLTAQIDVGPLHSVADGANGVHSEAAGVFPTASWRSSNYFVDLVTVPAVSTPAQVTSTSPAANAANVARAASVSATFSRAMDPTSLTGTSFTLTGPAGSVPATVSYDSVAQVATLVPSAPLAYSTAYTATLSGAVRSLDGIPLSAVSWTFTVTAPVPPQVTSTVPAAGSSDVGSSAVVRATFSKSIDVTTLNSSTFTLTGPSGAVAGAVSYDDSTRTASLVPSAALAAGTYTAQLAASVTATDQSTLGTPYSWSFAVTAGLAPPAVTATTPANASTGTARTGSVTATFSRSMDSATITPTTFTLTGPAGAVSAAVSYDSTARTASLTPATALSPGATYTATISLAVKAADGTPLGAAVSWSFTTALCPCSLFSSTLTPAVTNLSTQDGRGGSGPWTYEFGVKVTVDDPMQVSAIRFYKSPGETGIHVGRIWTAAGTQLASVTFTNETASGWQEQALASPFALQSATTYVISVNANTNFVMTSNALGTAINVGPLHSVAGGANGVHSEAAGQFPTASWLSSNYFVDLVTVPSVSAPPQVSSFQPAAGATGVARGSTVSATFSRAMDSASLTSSTFTLSGPSGTVPATVSYDATTRATTLTPASPLAYSTTYTAQLASSVRSLDGVPLGSPISWSFTVAAPVPTQVTSVVPADGSAEVGPSAVSRATFSKSIDPTTLTSSTFTLTGPSGAVSGSVSYDDTTRTASFTPTAGLAAGSYTARLAATITATDQSTLGTPYSWTYTVVVTPAPQVAATSPANADTGVTRDAVVTATLNRLIDPNSLTTTTYHLKASDGTVVPASLAYNPSTKTISLSPSSTLGGSAVYTAEITSGLTAQDGTPFPATTWSFTTGACPCSLFSSVLTPASTGNPTQDGRSGAGPFSYEFGVKFTVDQPLTLVAIRFYKDPLETGTHTGRLWSIGTGEGGPLGGVAISSVDFTSESASGWQQQLSSPVTLQPGITYMVSVNANAFFDLTVGGLASAVSNGPLHSVADAGNGAYAPAAGQFPTQSYNTSNYFVDLVVR